MTVDASAFGELAAEMMDLLATKEGDLVGAAIVAIVVDDDGEEATHVVCDQSYAFQRIGVFEAALDAVREIERQTPSDDDSDDSGS